MKDEKRVPNTPYTGEHILKTLVDISKAGVKDPKSSLAAQIMEDIAAEGDAGLPLVLALAHAGYNPPDVFVGIELGLRLASTPIEGKTNGYIN